LEGATVDRSKYKVETAIVVRHNDTSSAIVASVSPDDLAELLVINRAMVVGGVGVFVREKLRLDALIQKITAVAPLETTNTV
jgi:hypothetical protein